MKQGDALLFASAKILMNKSKSLSRLNALIRPLVLEEDQQLLCDKGLVQLCGKLQECCPRIQGDRDEAQRNVLQKNSAFSQGSNLQAKHAPLF